MMCGRLDRQPEGVGRDDLRVCRKATTRQEVSTLMIRDSDALLVIDVQRDILPGGALAVPDGDEVALPDLGCPSKADLIKAMEDHVVAEAAQMGTYCRE